MTTRRADPDAEVRTRRASPLAPEKRRAAIIEAVLPMLVDRGTAPTTRELAKAAGVAEGTIFKVFADKDDLLRASVERAIDPTDFEHAVRQLDPALDFEDRLVEATALMQRRMLGIWRLLSQVDHELHRRGADRRFPDSEAMVALFAASPGAVVIDPLEAARRLRALVLGLGNPMLMDPPLSPAEIVDLFLRGVGARR